MSDIEKLVELLGAESGNKWIDFMLYIDTNLSHILRPGKPKSDDIENSLVGELGFKSWKQLVETAVSEKGLGWNLGTFDSWKRAFALVSKNEYLKSLELSASFINTIYRESKPDFPASLDEFNAFLAHRTELQTQRQQNSLKDAQNRNAELVNANKVLETKLIDFEQQKSELEQLKIKNTTLDVLNNELQQTKNSLVERIHKQNKELKTLASALTEHKNRTFLSKLKSLFS